MILESQNQSKTKEPTVMNVQITENKLLALYIEVDDLHLEYVKYQKRKGLLAKNRPTRVSQLNGSEVCTILVAYHHSGYKCFEYYYRNSILIRYKSCFPEAPSYECFLSYIEKATSMIYLWLLYSVSQSKKTGLYFIDSKKLPVCHLRREKSHKVFKGIARKGKSSTGWFFGLKIHLIINNLGEIVAFDLTTGNVADNNQKLLLKLLNGLNGYCVGDKGYFTKLFDTFYENGLHLITKPKKKMKPLPTKNLNNMLINKRGIVESTFDILMTVCDIEHTRHRKPINAATHILAALIAYQFLEKKPTVFFPSIQKGVVNKAA